MALVSAYNYFVVFMLVFGVVCINADGIENAEIDLETFASRNQLLDSMFNKSLILTEYVFGRSEELCSKIIDDDIFKNATSVDVENQETVLKNCRNRVVDYFDPTGRRYGSNSDATLLLKYGFEDIKKIVDQKYEDFFKDIVQQIDDYVKGLTPEQQTRTTARNLRKWSSKIKSVPTLKRKEMFFRSCMRFYYFERGV